LGTKGQRDRAVGGDFVGADQPHLLALALGVDSPRESRDLLLRAVEVVEPQVGGAWEADPDGFVREPFGGKVGHDVKVICLHFPERRRGACSSEVENALSRRGPRLRSAMPLVFARGRKL
jgi:hypothetical protein